MLGSSLGQKGEASHSSSLTILCPPWYPLIHLHYLSPPFLESSQNLFPKCPLHQFLPVLPHSQDILRSLFPFLSGRQPRF